MSRTFDALKKAEAVAKTKQLVGGAVILNGGELVDMSKKSQAIRTGLNSLLKGRRVGASTSRH